MKKFNQLAQLTRIHFLELLREPGVIFWGIGFPVLMALGLGLAFTQKQDIYAEIAVVDQYQGIPAFQQIIDTSVVEKGTDKRGKYIKIAKTDSAFGNTWFKFRYQSWDEALQNLKRGKTNIILTSASSGVRYHFDPMNPDARLIYEQLTEIMNGNLTDSNTDVQPLEVQGSRYIDFLIPGLIGLGIMMGCMWGLSYKIIERRKGKMLRRMIATPMKKFNLMVAHMSSRIALNFIEAFFVYLIVAIVFRVIIQGSIAAVIVLMLAGNFAFCGIAILISSRTANSEIGNALINLITMPMMVLSGIFFSYQNFPDWSIAVIKFLPMTMLVDGIRAIFNEGAGFNEIMIPALILTVMGLITLIAGIRIFKWH